MNLEEMGEVALDEKAVGIDQHCEKTKELCILSKKGMTHMP